MSNPEQATGNSIESLPIKVSYELLDRYGQRLSTGTSLQLGETDWRVTSFDGYVETPFGNFAFEGPIKAAREMLKDITDYVAAKQEYEGLKPNLEKAQAKRVEATTRWQSGAAYISSSEAEAAIRELREAEEQMFPLEFRIKSYTERLAPYRV